MPSSKTCVCSLRNPRVKIEVNWPAVPVWTMDSPGTSRSALLSRSQAIDRAEYQNASRRRPLAQLPLRLVKESATFPARSRRPAQRRVTQVRERALSENKTKLDDFAYRGPPNQRVGFLWPRRHRQLSFFFLRRSFFVPHSRDE